MKNIYYTYAWYFGDTGNVFYIGKGHGRRHREKKDRNDKFKKYISKHICHVKKIHEGLTEQEAYDKEIELIAHYKQLGQCECNFTVGGDAPPVHIGAEAPNRRSVVQLSLSGEYIKTWPYISKVEKELRLQNTRITVCCKGGYGNKSYGGFMWVYEEEYDKNKNYEYIRETNRKPILQYDLAGNFVKEWEGAIQVTGELGFRRSSLCSCCKGDIKSCGGYIWRYKDGDEVQKIIKVKPHKTIPTPVVQLTLDGRYIRTFKDATQAVISLGKKQSDCAKVLGCCKGKRKTAYKYKWVYEYDHHI